MIRKIVSIVVLASAILMAQTAPAPAPVGGKDMTETTGTKADWSIIALGVKKYVQIRNLVKAAYIEVQTWKALKANWDAQMQFFQRNKERWDRISKTVSNLSSDPSEMLSNLRKIEDVTKEIDNFVMYAPQEMNTILLTYEDNVSNAWDVAGPYLGNGYTPSTEIWKKFNTFMQDHTLRNAPDWKKNVEALGEDPGYGEPIYDLVEWKRRNILGKSYSLISSQNGAAAMRRNEREKYWSGYQQQVSALIASNPKPDAIQGADISRRVQTLSDVNDLIMTKILASNAMITQAGDEIFRISSEIQQTAGGVNEQRQISKIIAAQVTP